MQKVRTERGITLIALIITIIVMLILVGVTVSVSLNGGLFTTAKQATNKTQLELDKEQLLELALGAMSNKGNIDPSKITAGGTFEYDEETKIYTSKLGNKFVVNEWGGVTEAPVYELSGAWMFKDTILPETAETEGEYLIQDITFTSNGDIYNQMSVEFLEYMFSEIFTLNIFYDEIDVYDSYVGEFANNTCTVDFGETSQEVSKEFYEWFTTNATKMSEYNLSGMWEFVNSPGPQTAINEGIYLNENISFTAVGEEEGYTGLITYGSIRVAYNSTEEENPEYFINIYYDNQLIYEGASDEWHYYDGMTNDCRIVYFGGVIKEVSEEFYNWFTANATQVQ